MEGKSKDRREGRRKGRKKKRRDKRKGKKREEKGGNKEKLCVVFFILEPGDESERENTKKNKGRKGES